MPDGLHTAAIAAARNELGAIEQKITAAEAEMSRVESELTAKRRTAASSQPIIRLENRLKALATERAAAMEQRTALKSRLVELRSEAVSEITPEEAVATLDGQVPIVLLPVRLETRFFDDASTLRIRIFPDDIHVHTHEPQLTEAEESAGREYWLARVDAAGDAELTRLAWRNVASAHGPHRGAWIVAATTPLNLDAAGSSSPEFPEVPERGATWTRAPRVAAMPDRWVAIGFRGGGELFRRWGNVVADDLSFGPAPDPAADFSGEEASQPAAVEDDLPIDDDMRWLIDFAEAERIGMAITVRSSDIPTGASLNGGLDLLLVVGVDWTRSPVEAARIVAELLDSHRYTEGLALVAAGTPTNNTRAGRSAGLGPEGLLEAADPAAAPGQPPAASQAKGLTAALGLEGVSPLAGVPGALLDGTEGASHMHNALWEATWGYFFDHILDGVATQGQVNELRDHFRNYVRGGGPLGTLRIGAQPYGVLPVVAPGHWRPGDDEFSGRALMKIIDDGRGLWRQAADRSPHMGRSGDRSRDLLEVLQHTPVMSTIRFRTVFGPLFAANTGGLVDTARFQELTGRWLLSMLGGETLRPRIAVSVIHPTSRRLTVPLVQAEPTGDVELNPNYFRSIFTRLTRVGGFVSVRKDEPASLLHALLMHGAQLEVGKAARNLISDLAVSNGDAMVVDGPEPELVDIAEGTVTKTPVRLAESAVAAISGRRTLANHIATIPDPGDVAATKSFASFRASLDHLANLPVGELERLFVETIDSSSHRLDAWLTSFATRRLETVRGATPVGLHIGGFGWVENLRPDPPGDSLGFVHTPSLGHAAAAAILRSGHLGHASQGVNPLAIDLSSQRVREALSLIEGVQQGQPIGALLGYRFERALRERDVRLARYILPFRRLAPLALDTEGTSEVSEAIAARDVVDGVVLLQLRRAGESALLERAGVAGSDLAAVADELARLDDRLDAASDILVAESVFQAVTGNLDRAGAAAGALDRQRTPPTPEFIRTPRTGHDHVHRVSILLGDAEVPPAWREGATDPRAAAEPRLNAWAAHILGDPKQLRCAAEVVDGSGTVIQELEASLSDLGLSPLSALALAGSGGTDQPTELEQMFALHFTGAVADPDNAAELRLRTGRLASWPNAARSLGDLLTVAGAARRLIGGARPLNAADLSLPEEDLAPGVDVDELESRAATIIARADQAVDRLTEAIESQASSADRFRTVLSAASAVGARDAAPLTPDSGTDAVAALREQALDVARRLSTAVDAARELVRPVSGATTDEVAMAAFIKAIQALLGADFPVLPLFRIPDPLEVSASLADRTALTGDDDLAPTAWMQRRAMVRARVGQLLEVLTYAELGDAGTDPTDLTIIQLPHAPGDPWVAAPLPPDGALPVGRISIVSHCPTKLDPAAPLAGLLIDDWMETIPSSVETTGVAFHYDAPGSRAPQALLLAVPPDPTAGFWSFEAVRDTVVEAFELAKIRAVDPQQIWMAGRVLPALYVAHNVVGDTSTLDFFDLQKRVGAHAGGLVVDRDG